MSVRDITKLTDYPLIEKLAQTLWQRDKFGHGVAIMVGAGFSRSGATTYDTDKKLPLWGDLAQKLAVELGESEHTDALRLAQMYHDYFGKLRLYDLLKNAVEDEIWEPTELYQELLTLPWSEVLTTNWDTLLERASKNIHEPIYDVVSKQEDLASCHSPRIVKLHGTINVSSDLIFTQEDYRCYPQKYGIFVNFVRQVFVENELCLIGFSGDDPNFLQWIGWVRDNLQSNARRIYLVGVLNLSAAKRKYLESLNVASIDLFNSVKNIEDKDVQHKNGIELFLNTLFKLAPKKPCEWMPSDLNESIINPFKSYNFDNSYLYKNNLSTIHKNLMHDRLTYPNWLICPIDVKTKLQENLSKLLILINKLIEVNREFQEKILYEIFWIYQIIFKKLPLEIFNNIYIQRILEICDTNICCSLSKKQQLEISLFLLKNSRWMPESKIKDQIENRTYEIIKNNLHHWPEIKTEISYFHAMIALDKFDYISLKKHISDISGRDPVWKLRKAYLLTMLGELDTSALLIEETIQILSTSYKKDENSIFVLSRLAWSKYIQAMLNLKQTNISSINIENEFKKQKYAPNDRIIFLYNQISRQLKDEYEQKFKPSFKVGFYQEIPKQFVPIQDAECLLFEFDKICYTVGFPIFWHKNEFLKTIGIELSKINGIDNWKKFFLSINTAEDENADSINVFFSRKNVALFSENEVCQFVDCCFNAIEYWVENCLDKSINSTLLEYSQTRLFIFLEILARLQIRLESEKAFESFKKAITLGKNHLKIFENSESLKHLIENSIKSIPISKHDILINYILEFPLCPKIGLAGELICKPTKRGADHNIKNNISQLINIINISGNTTNLSKGSLALNRLLFLVKQNLLTNEEQDELSKAVFGNNFEKVDLFQTKFFLKVFLIISTEDNKEKVINLIKEKLFSNKQIIGHIYLENLAFLVSDEKDKLFLPSKLAEKYFDDWIEWFSSVDRINYGFPKNMDDTEIGSLLSEVLSTSIVPSLSSKSKTQNRFEKLKIFYTNYKYNFLIRAFIPFVLSNSDWSKQVEKIIRHGLKSVDERMICNSAYAILDWGNGLLNPKKEIRILIEKLINQIDSGNLRGLKDVLVVINIMFTKKWLLDSDVDILKENLPEIFVKSNYSNFVEGEIETIGVPSVRANCVKLARDILTQSKQQIPELQIILDNAKDDAFPEVRFAELKEYCI